MLVKKIFNNQVVGYLVVGLLTVFIDVSVTSVSFRYFGVTAFYSSVIGFMSGFFVSFPINRKKVFNHSDHDRHRLQIQILMYLGLSLFNIVFISYVVDVVVAAGLLKIEYIKIVMTGLAAVWNFLTFKYLIFSKNTTL